MRRTSAAPSRFDGARDEIVTSTGPNRPDEMSGRVLGIISAYRMGAVVETRELFPKPAVKTVPEPAPRPAEGYIRNGVYHVADTARAHPA